MHNAKYIHKHRRIYFYTGSMEHSQPNKRLIVCLWAELVACAASSSAEHSPRIYAQRTYTLRTIRTRHSPA